MSNIKLIVGLANPGVEYSFTRHNAGAWYVNLLAQTYHQVLKKEAKFFGYVSRLTISNHDIRLLIPSIFMNLSGNAVRAIANFYHIDPADILIVHDELDLPPGTAKFKFGGSNGGHNGLKSISNQLNNNTQFHRLRIGIGHPGDKNKVTGFVLGRAPVSEQRLIDDSINEAIRCTEILLSQGMADAMNCLHAFKAKK